MERARVVAGVDTIDTDGRPVVRPRFELLGPLPTTVVMQYRVRPGVREGDSHIGFTGRCLGYQGADLVFATGRQLFLLPRLHINRTEVRFHLPPGWTVAAPWARAGNIWHPGIGGSYQAEHLVSAALGLGRFHERSFVLGATRFGVALEAAIPPSKQTQIVGTLERATRYLHGVLGGDLGPDYLTIGLLTAPNGDEIVGEGWGTGQGGTLWPLTADRARNYCEQWIGAHLRFAPYRSQIRDRAEYWLVDGIAGLYSWRAAAVVGLVPENEIEREFASRYVETLPVRGVERNLERVYATTGDRKLSTRVLAPFTLIQMDRALRHGSQGLTTLDQVLSTMFLRPRAGSLWQRLSSNEGRDWAGFRDRYVRGKAILPLNEILSIAPTLPEPNPRAAHATRKITVAFTGNTHGYLENCGCKVNQSGGIARRATALRRIRSLDPGALLFDAGSAFPNVGGRTAPDFLAAQEESFYLQVMETMRYDAVAVGMTELLQGPEHFLTTTRSVRVPYVGSNVSLDSDRSAPKSLQIQRAGLRIGVLGILEPPRGPRANARTSTALSKLAVEDPLTVIQRDLPSLRKHADIIVILGCLSPMTIRSVVQACPDVDVIISTDYQLPSIVSSERGSTLQQNDPPGFLGKTLVLYTSLENYGIQVAHLEADPNGRIASAEFEDCWLRENVPEDPGVRTALDQFYARVGRMAESQASVAPLFEGDHQRMTGHYVGAKQCEGCHSLEYEQWKGTKHASAYKTLLDAHRHYQPRCVVCHVVGFGTPHGYRLGDHEEPLANVQCEVCHGPGEDHIAAPSRVNITRAVPQAVCLQCHNPDHSDNFVFSEKIPRVRHLE